MKQQASCVQLCSRLLKELRWDWNNPKVEEVQARYGYVGQLPLAGYQELFKILDDEWFAQGGGF